MGTIKSGTIIDSPVTGDRFRVAELLGRGAFGRVRDMSRLTPFPAAATGPVDIGMN